MPGIFRLVAQFVPLNYYLVFVRAVLLKGARWVDMWPQLAILTGLGCVIAVIATLTISRNLD
jgi:ABC-2 type transport system permease protein